MNILKYLRGGLNLDDSPEVMDPEDWTYALNVVDGRSYGGKGGEKENILGTNSVNATVRQVLVNQNGTFLTWINDGSGTDWVLGSSPSITLLSGQSSKNLKLLLPNPSSGKINVQFEYAATGGNRQTLYCAIRNGSSVIEAKELTVINSLTIVFNFETSTEIDNIIIYTVQPILTERIIPGKEYDLNGLSSESESNAGQTHLTFVSGTNLGLPNTSVITTNPPPVTYYNPHTPSAANNEFIRALLVSTSATTSPLHLASIRAWSPTVIEPGSTIRAEVYVYVPSGTPITTHGSYEFYLDAESSDGVQFTTSSPINRTVAESTNAWKKVSLTATINLPLAGRPSNLVFKLKIKNPSNLSDPNTLTAGGKMYVDSFWTYNSAASASTITISTASVNTIGEEPVVNTDYQHIGTVKALDPETGDVINYLFFYHNQLTPTPQNNHTIYKLDNSGRLSVVLIWSGLNFNPLYRINGGGVSGNLLYFTDGLNQPRCVHLTRYANGAVPSSEEEILHIKRGPLFPPVISYTKTITPTLKKIDDAQFSYQYEYIDGQLSVIAPWSDLVRGEGGSTATTVDGVVESVIVSIGTTETFPVNIKRIKFVARKNNTGAPFYIGDVEANFFQSAGTVTYKEQNEGIIESIYLKQFESIPLKVGASCISKSRAWFANYTEGYDTPVASDKNPTTNVRFTSFSIENIGSEVGTGLTFGPNSKYSLGIVLHDDQGRSCGVIDRGYTISTDKAIKYDQTRKRLSYQVGGVAPLWAKQYSVVITKDLIKSNFINQSFSANTGTEYYVLVDGSGVETYTMTYSSSVKYVRLLYQRNKIGIGYSASVNDSVMVTNDLANVTYGPVKILKQVGDYIYVEPINIGSGAFPLNYQIYTPITANDGLYFEVARYNINADQTIDTTAHKLYGDCENIVTYGTFKMPQMRVRPADGPWNTWIGKPYIKTTVGQVYKRNFIKYSSPFIGESNINGLSEFNIGDDGKTAYDAGKIQKLIPTSKEATEGDVILAICASDTYSVYIDENRLSSGNDTLLVASPQVIGDIRKQKSGYGTINPESVIEEDGDVYWFDALSGAYVRYASNGIFPISDYKVSKYFREKGHLYSQGGTAYGNGLVDRGQVYSGYDPYYKIIYVTLNGETIGFSIDKERWMSFYGFDGIEGMFSASDHLYSIIGGAIFKHNNDDEFNSFYGNVQDSIITCSFNESRDAKEWRIIEIEASSNFKQWISGNQVVAGTSLRVDLTNRNGQETNILSNEFEVDEDCIYGEIRGDINSGTILSGEPMYSKTLQCMLTFSGGAYKQITSLKAGFEISRGHNL
jgi:hypothetical protein